VYQPSSKRNQLYQITAFPEKQQWASPNQNANMGVTQFEILNAMQYPLMSIFFSGRYIA